MASITKTKHGYRAQIYVKGHRESETFTSKREAVNWSISREEYLRNDNNKPVSERHTFADCLEKYRDEVSPYKDGHRWEFVRINAFLKSALPISLPIGKVTSEAIGQWRDVRLKTVSAGSVLRDFSLLSDIFEVARREWKWILVNPVKDVRKPRSPDHREITIHRWQIKKMLRNFGYSPTLPIRTISQSAAAVFILALRSGMRAGEICNLTWSNVMDDYCKLPKTKTTPREVPLSPKAIRLIKRLDGFDSVTVFGIKAQTLDALFRRTRDRAGLAGFTFHDSRHTAATWISRKVDILTLCKIFGWKDPKHALIYFNPKSSDMAKLL